MAYKLLIVKEPDGRVGFSLVEGTAQKDELLGGLAIVEHTILNPPVQPAVVAAPAGALHRLNGHRGPEA